MSLGLSTLSPPPPARGRNSNTPIESPGLRSFDDERPHDWTPDEGESDCGVDAEVSRTECGVEYPEALLDTPGVTLHRSLDDLERARSLLGLALAAKLESVGQDTFAGKLRGCHTDLSFAVCNACGIRKPFWNRCDILWCPQCSPRLANKRLESLMWFVLKMRQPKHIVLTIRNVPNLTKAFLRNSQKALTRLRRCKIFRGCRSGFWAMEITNKGRGWHVHFHLVADCPWMDVRALSDTWRACNRMDSGVVWIEDATKGGLKANLPRYVTKYTAKGFGLHEWEAQELAQFVTAIQGVRVFGVFGELLGARKEWRQFIKDTKKYRRRCACGACSWTYYSRHELEWKDEFTGFTNAIPSRAGPCLSETSTRQLGWRLGITNR